jgi:hypothetical protein
MNAKNKWFWDKPKNKTKSNMFPGLGLAMRPTVIVGFAMGNLLKFKNFNITFYKTK